MVGDGRGFGCIDKYGSTPMIGRILPIMIGRLSTYDKWEATGCRLL